MENKKRKHKQPVFAVDKETFGFIGVFPSGQEASRILLERDDQGPAVLKCARGEQKYVKRYRFTFIDLDEPFTSETIKNKTMEIKNRAKSRDTLVFKASMTKHMEQKDYDTLKALYDKYNSDIIGQVKD